MYVSSPDFDDNIDFIELLLKYNNEDVEIETNDQMSNAQHEIIAEEYVQLMADVLESFHKSTGDPFLKENNVTHDFYYYYSLMGLYKTLMGQSMLLQIPDDVKLLLNTYKKDGKINCEMNSGNE